MPVRRELMQQPSARALRSQVHPGISLAIAHPRRIRRRRQQSSRAGVPHASSTTAHTKPSRISALHNVIHAIVCVDRGLIRRPQIESKLRQTPPQPARLHKLRSIAEQQIRPISKDLMRPHSPSRIAIDRADRTAVLLKVEVRRCAPPSAVSARSRTCPTDWLAHTSKPPGHSPPASPDTPPSGSRP